MGVRAVTVVWVFLAGGLGSAARYLIGLSMNGATFPYGTVLVNLVGCFFLGVVAHAASAGTLGAEARAVIAVGFLGGFTTYSSFNQETLTMFASGATGTAFLNVAITLAGGLAAGALGLTAGRFLTT
ncbi:MAG TPA: fluoride efflux transporter CrcB [Vicinamibacterales bacterium]|nr:fluoride efflux transporter CrcB [Vicinamibacterales bacterium]